MRVTCMPFIHLYVVYTGILIKVIIIIIIIIIIITKLIINIGQVIAIKAK